MERASQSPFWQTVTEASKAVGEWPESKRLAAMQEVYPDSFEMKLKQELEALNDLRRRVAAGFARYKENDPDRVSGAASKADGHESAGVRVLRSPCRKGRVII